MGFHFCLTLGGDAGQITVNGELNKLAHNISFGHGIHAGIHWRSDTDSSIQLGEALAISVLQDRALTYNEKFTVNFTKIDGTTATISNQEPLQRTTEANLIALWESERVVSHRFKGLNAECSTPIDREEACHGQHRIRETGEGGITLPLVHPKLCPLVDRMAAHRKLDRRRDGSLRGRLRKRASTPTVKGQPTNCYGGKSGRVSNLMGHNHGRDNMRKRAVRRKKTERLTAAKKQQEEC